MSYELKHCDCYDFISSLEDKSIDLVITDPPYQFVAQGQGLYSNDRTKKKKCLENLDKLDCCNFVPAQFLELIKPKMKKFYGYFFCNKILIPDYLNYAVQNKYSFDILCLTKKNPIPSKNNHFLPDIEYCILIRESGTFWSKEANFDDYRKLFEVTCCGKRLHPAEKPVEFLERFVRVSCPEDGLVFDPFSGSGSTGIACLKNRRNFIGCEKDADYFTLAESRLKECNAEETGIGSLFDGLEWP